MADVFDKATEREEQDRALCLKVRMPEGPEPNGQCHNCGEVVEEGRRFCDSDCRDDWQRWQRNK